MDFNYEIDNIDNNHLLLTVYLRNNIATISHHLYKEDIDFFKRLRNNIESKSYEDNREVLIYEDETLLFFFDIYDYCTILRIDDKEFIKHMCDAIVEAGKDITLNRSDIFH